MALKLKQPPRGHTCSDYEVARVQAFHALFEDITSAEDAAELIALHEKVVELAPAGSARQNAQGFLDQVRRRYAQQAAQRR